MDAVKFLRERNRMCEGGSCNGCPIRKATQGTSCDLFGADVEEIVEVVKVVENWSRENLGEAEKKSFMNFTKYDIREFDVVEFRDGRMSLVVNFDGDGKLETANGYIGSYADDLTRFGDEDDKLWYADIMKVYRPKDNLPMDKSKWKNLPLIWERKEVKKMTVDEISEALGYKVEVVGEESK